MKSCARDSHISFAPSKNMRAPERTPRCVECASRSEDGRILQHGSCCTDTGWSSSSSHLSPVQHPAWAPCGPPFFSAPFGPHLGGWGAQFRNMGSQKWFFPQFLPRGQRHPMDRSMMHVLGKCASFTRKVVYRKDASIFQKSGERDSSNESLTQTLFFEMFLRGRTCGQRLATRRPPRVDNLLLRTAQPINWQHVFASPCSAPTTQVSRSSRRTTQDRAQSAPHNPRTTRTRLRTPTST